MGYCSEQRNLVARRENLAEPSELAQKVYGDGLGATDGPRNFAECLSGGERVLYLTAGTEVLNFVRIQMLHIDGGEPARSEGSSTPLIA